MIWRIAKQPFMLPDPVRAALAFKPQTEAEQRMFNTGFEAATKGGDYLPPSAPPSLRESYDAGYGSGVLTETHW